MPKFKYPKTIKTKVKCKIPVQNERNKWESAILHEDGNVTIKAHAEHHTEESCWICCKAHNKRIGFTHEEVQEAIKKTGFKSKKDKEKEREKERKKVKSKKGKKGKKNKSKNKSKSR